MYQYYSHLALGLAKSDYSKLCDLLSHYDNMDRDTIIEYLGLIAEQAISWDDSKKYPFWKELINQKEWLIHNNPESLDEFMMSLLESAINQTTPIDIRYSYRRIYESGYFYYDDDGDFNTKWEAKHNKQQTAVYEIFTTYGINAVVEFAQEVNNEAWIAQNLGKKLSNDDIKALLKMCHESKLRKNFLASIIDGYIIANGYEALTQIELNCYTSNYIAWILSCIRPSMQLFDIAQSLLNESIDLYWDIISIPRYGLDDSINLNYVWNQLVS